jgi:DNA-binding NtrC family response regulator
MRKMGSILVVDDDLGVRESLRMMFESVYEVHTVANGQEALSCIEKEKIDLVTLDLHMPGLTGIDTLREMRKMNPGVGVIVITGYGTLRNAQEVIRYGAEDMISKPFDVPEVICRVSRAFDRARYNQKIMKLIDQIKKIHSGDEAISLAKGNAGF